MLARAHTFTIDGLQAQRVAVEVDVRPGLPAFAIVGLADVAIREARERVRAAIVNSGFAFPPRRITANLAPADLPKVGPGLDLALACAVLAASEQLADNLLESHALFGELGLDGSVRATRGTLAVAAAARSAGLRTLVLAGERAAEASLIEGLRVAVAERLASAVRILSGGPADPGPGPGPAGRGALAARGTPAGHRAVVGHDAAGGPQPDLGEVRGQHHAVRALVIAAAGGHNLLLSGPPGTGKTMLAQRLPSILPPLGVEEAVETTQIHSLAAAGSSPPDLIRQPPFRAPHHSITAAGLIGGAQRGAQAGEVVLAHNGVLFLDELSEFARSALESLRQPLEDGRVAVVRASRTGVYPCRFVLIAATNPCPCGYAGEVERCRCSEAELARYRHRLSGPLLDRIDLFACMHRETDRQPPLCSSTGARELVLAARRRQLARQGTVNARLDPAMLVRVARMDERGERMLRRARESGLLSARGEGRLLRVARTVADLAASEPVRASDLGVALALRPDTGLAAGRAA